MKEIMMGENEKRAFNQAIEYANDWCRNHQWEIGVAEMALGAGVIALGVQNGAIEMGRDIVGSATSSFNLGNKAGAAVGGGIGLVAGAVIGGIGIATGGVAVGIPTALVVGGGALLLGSLGYTSGDLIHNFLNPPIDVGQFFANTSLMAVGIALLIDGARRIIKDARVLAAASRVMNGIIYLVDLAVKVVARSMAELKDFMRHLVSMPDSIMDGGQSVVSVVIATAGATGGVAVGGSVAAGMVTVLGSHALGGLAVALGLASAPLWPVIAGGAAGLGIGYGSWKAINFLGTKLAGRR